MTKLGGPSELGDIDVLGVKNQRASSHWTCRMQTLTTCAHVAEIAEICRRFRGEPQDELEKTSKACRMGKAEHFQSISSCWIQARAGQFRLSPYN